MTDALESLSGLPKAHAWATLGMIAREQDNAQADTALKKAMDILTEPRLGLDDISHPYVAYLHERLAWSLVYQWKLRSAEEHFRAAHGKRWVHWSDHHDALAFLNAQHDLHGLAMAERYRGDCETARKHYDNIILELELNRDRLMKSDKTDTVPPPNAGSPSADWQVIQAKFNERSYNTPERRADCDLYNPASFTAEKGLEACKRYSTARQYAVDPAARLAMSLKLAITQTLCGTMDDPARQEYDDAQKLHASGKISLGGDRRRIELLSRIATALVAERLEKDPKTAQAQLRKIFEDLRRARLKGEKDQPNNDRCEVQELHLFCLELLLTSVLSTHGAAEAKRDLESFQMTVEWLLAPFEHGSAERKALLPYLRHYHEIATEVALEAGDPSLAAIFIEVLRCWDGQDGTATLFFFFQDDHMRQRWSVAILRRREGDCLLFKLPHTREQIRAGLQGKVEPLPENLVQYVKQEREQGRPVSISWSDKQCWPSPDTQAILDTHWPYAEQLGSLPTGEASSRPGATAIGIGQDGTMPGS